MDSVLARAYVVSMDTDNRTNAGTWTEIARQSKQKRCHGCGKRTFYWLFERGGAICSDCVNLRSMVKPVPESASAGESTNGKNGKSKIAPAKKIAIIARRAAGETKASISRELHVAHNTVTKVLNEADFDRMVEQGRWNSGGLIPVALEGLEISMRKGDGQVCNRFLENVGVLAEKPRKSPGDPTLVLAISNLMGGLTVQAAPAPAIDVTPIPSSPSSSQP
jgi:protein-arginine kinase activator protein McsA